MKAETRKKLRPLWILLSAMAGVSVILVLLLSLGVFKSYRYDEIGFSVGGGTVFEPVTDIEIDWYSGPIQIELCEDENISVSEYAKEELSENETLRLKIEDGKLSVKSRESTGLLLQSPEAKVLILRIPANLADGVRSLNIRVRNGAGQIDCDFLPSETNIQAKNAKVTLTLPKDCGFTLDASHLDGTPSGVLMDEQDGKYIYAGGGANLSVTAKRLNISTKTDE